MSISSPDEITTRMSKSPLKSSPLRNPGQSLDEELQNLLMDKALPYVMSATMMTALTAIEWFRWYLNIPPKPILYTIIAFMVIAYSVFKLFHVKRKVKTLRLGRDGEKAVGQYLEELRAQGAKVFHDVKGPNFNIDHVVIHNSGIYVIETKTFSKPDKGTPKILFDGEAVRVMGVKPDRDPVRQVRALSSWLRDLLLESTGKTWTPRPVVVFPGWYIEPTAEARNSDVWVLNPKALPAFIAHSKLQLPPEDVKLSAFHLSRFIRTTR